MKILFFLWNIIQKITRDLFPDPLLIGFYGNSRDTYFLLHIFIIITLYGAFILIKKRSIPIQNHTNNNSNLNKFKNFCYCFLFYIFLFITIIQTAKHFQYFSATYGAFSNKTLDQKRFRISGTPYIFSKTCQKILNGQRLTANLITDLDLSKDPGMTIHRMLSYYLYPSVNIRSHNQKDQPDCLIFYNKRNARQHVPLEYTIKHQFNQNNLLAIRKNNVGNF